MPGAVRGAEGPDSLGISLLFQSSSRLSGPVMPPPRPATNSRALTLFFCCCILKTFLTPLLDVGLSRETYLRDLVGDVVRAVFDFGGDDGFLRGRRGRALLLVVGFREVERDERDLVDGAVLVEVGVGGGAQQAGLDLTEWSFRGGMGTHTHTHRKQNSRVRFRRDEPLLGVARDRRTVLSSITVLVIHGHCARRGVSSNTTQ